MRASVPKRTAETRLVKRYHKLYVPLVELVQTLQDLEPGTMLIDSAEFTKTDKNIRVEYKVRPVRLMIDTDDQRLMLQIEEFSKDARSVTSPARKDTYVA
ncbi:MAG: hypothetical protein JWP06_640 [Candidatus Saccharibacteria bacterium]|nr:hypothetical protein [Candidatus Saccharibacteria bacterium]